MQEAPPEYDLLEPIGSGGAGEVYLAHDRRLGRQVAIKFLNLDAGADEGMRRRFVREARSAAAIDHPFVCKVYEAGTDGGRAYIAMEFVDGRPLDHWLQSNPPMLARIKVALEIVEAVEAAHAKGFLHRDLKPSNILVTAGTHPKVLDFGVAKELDRQSAEADVTQAGQVFGTPEYLSPEQASGDPVDFRSDIFGLGIVLYEMFSGVHPFRRDTAFKSMVAIATEAVPPLADRAPELPVEFAFVVERMLAKVPADRPFAMSEVLDLLAASSGPGGAQREDVHDSVAVLPFANLSPSPGDEHFVAGVVEELITRLSKIEGLKVISRTSTMKFEESGEDLMEFGRRLGVSTVVEGSVRRATDRVRIAARLISVRSSEQIWGDTFDRPTHDLFAVQDDVAARIAEVFEQQIPDTRRPAPGAVTSDLTTYDQYLRARHFMHTSTPEGIRRALEQFTRVIEREPDFALAHAGLAICHAYAGHFGYEPPGDAFPRARKVAERALALDERLAEAHTSLGLVASLYEWDWATAERRFLRAMELDPNSAPAHLHLSWCLTAIGQYARAISAVSIASTLDPLSAFNQMSMGWIQFFSGLYSESLVHYRRALELEPDNPLVRNLMGATFLGMGRYDEAITLFEEVAALNRMHLAWAYMMAGRNQDAAAVVEEVRAAGEPTNLDLGIYLLLAGSVDDGFAALERSLDERDSRLPYIPDHPFLAAYESDPRMIRLRTRIGLNVRAA